MPKTGKNFKIYKIKEKEYHHSFWICYIIGSALYIGSVVSLLLPVPHDHFQTRSKVVTCFWTHFKSHQKDIQSP